MLSSAQSHLSHDTKHNIRCKSTMPNSLKYHLPIIISCRLKVFITIVSCSCDISFGCLCSLSGNGLSSIINTYITTPTPTMIQSHFHRFHPDDDLGVPAALSSGIVAGRLFSMSLHDDEIAEIICWERFLIMLRGEIIKYSTPRTNEAHFAQTGGSNYQDKRLNAEWYR